MVHGMWSNPQVWKDGGFVHSLYNSQTGITNIPILLVDYEQLNTNTFWAIMSKPLQKKSAIKKDSALRTQKPQRKTHQRAFVFKVNGKSFGVYKTSAGYTVIEADQYHFGYGLLLRKDDKGNWRGLNNPAYQDLEDIIDYKLKHYEEALKACGK